MRKSVLALVATTFIVSFLFSSCVSQIGTLTMVSTRNIETQIQYKQLTTYTGDSKKELKKNKSLSLEEAINKTVKAVQGGEYLMNAKVYIVIGFVNKYAVSGDVWGKDTTTNN